MSKHHTTAQGKKTEKSAAPKADNRSSNSTKVQKKGNDNREEFEKIQSESEFSVLEALRESR